MNKTQFKQFVTDITTGKVSNVETAFNRNIKRNVGQLLDAKRVEIANNLFSGSKLNNK